MDQKNYQYAYDLAIVAGETPEMAAVFATYYAIETASWEDMIAEGEEVPAGGLEAKMLTEAWEFLGHYKPAIAKGHGPVWAYAYCRYLQYEYDKLESEEEGYRAVREKSPGVKGHNPAVLHEAKMARVERGPQYANAYTAAVMNPELYEPKHFDQYAELVVAQLQAGKSPLFADEYALSVCGDYDPKYAAIEADIYEQALVRGMDETYARVYSDKLAGDLYDYAVTPEDIAFYTEEADKHIAKMMQDAKERQQAKQAPKQ